MSIQPVRNHCAATRWRLDALSAALAQGHTWTLSRSSIWRLLDDVDLKPHRRVYGYNRHDPDFEAKAHTICSFVQNPDKFLAEHSHRVL